MQDGSCLVAMCEWLLTSSGMDLFPLVVVGVNSVVVVSIYSGCGVQAPLSLWCEVHFY